MPTKKHRTKVIKIGEALELPPEMLEQTFSTEKLKREDPKKYEAIVYGLSMGVRRQDLVDMFKVDSRVIRAVMVENESAVKGFRKNVAAELRFKSLEAMDYWSECLKRGELDPNKIPLAIAIMIDKADKLYDHADVVIEHRKSDAAIRFNLLGFVMLRSDWIRYNAIQFNKFGFDKIGYNMFKIKPI